MMDSKQWENLMDEKQHRLTYYGFKPEKKYAKQGFCAACHKNFVMRTALTDKFNYEDKTVWTGECPFCGNAFRIVDKALKKEPDEPAVEDRFVFKGISAFNWALQTILGLRKYYKNQMRCIFLMQGDSMIEEGVKRKFYPYEKAYYDYMVVTMIREIMEHELLKKCWFMTTPDIKDELMTKDAAKRKFISQMRGLYKAVQKFEDDNWEAFFGPQATLKAHEDENWKPQVKNDAEIKTWLKIHKTEVDEFKLVIMPVDYEGDSGVDADDGLEAEIEAEDAEIIKEGAGVVIEAEKTEGLDDLEYGVSKEYDV